MVTMETSVNSSNISELLKQTIIKFCQENYIPNSDGDLELDAIVCVSTVDAQNQDVVKIHQILNHSVADSRRICDEFATCMSKRNGYPEQVELENEATRKSMTLGLSLSTEDSAAVNENAGSDEKWLRMNRLKVYKKKRKIAVQRRKQSVTCKINQAKVSKDSSNCSSPNSGYMLRVPCIASQFTSVKSTVRNDEDFHAETENHTGVENETLLDETLSESTSFTKPVVKVEPVDVNEECLFSNGELMNEIPVPLQDTQRDGYEDIPSQSVFPPRQSDNYFLSQNDPENSAHNFTEQELSSLTSTHASTMDSPSIGKSFELSDPQIIRKRKRKQNSQSILRVSEMKVESGGDEGRKISSLLSGDSTNLESISNHNLEPRVPKIIIRNTTDVSLAEKSKKQPRLVSLLTSSIPSLLNKQQPSKGNTGKKENKISPEKTKNSVSSQVLDMADIASMQKAVSSTRVTSLLKQKLSTSPASAFPDDQIFYCSKCGTGFKSKKSKMRHEKYTCGELRSFECEMCGKFYSRADSKTRHMFRIHGIKPGLSLTQTNLNDSVFSADDDQNGSLDMEPDQNDTSEGFSLEYVNDSE